MGVHLKAVLCLHATCMVAGFIPHFANPQLRPVSLALSPAFSPTPALVCLRMGGAEDSLASLQELKVQLERAVASEEYAEVWLLM